MNKIEIQMMKEEHTEQVIEMMRVFYASPAVLSNGSEQIFRNDVENCVNESPYLEGYVFVEVDENTESAILDENTKSATLKEITEYKDSNILKKTDENTKSTILKKIVENKENSILKEKKENIIGYAMIAKSFSTEFGKPCMWIEDLYLKSNYRGIGIGTQFFSFVEKKYPNAILRLEVEEDNKRAIHVYEKNGFEILPYMEMKK